MRIQKSRTIIYSVLTIAVAGVILMLSTPRLDSAEAKRMIQVTTVDQLYLAVNNAANNDATIHLAPGTYVLSATNSEGGSRPNAGVLRLRPGMSLEGSEEHVD